MGCNCGGNKPRPPRPAAPAPAPSKPMQGQTQTFALDLSTGQRFTFGSRLEAEAANVRAGYTGTITPL